MKFLLDQDVYAITGRFLREQGHDVLTASAAGLSRADDLELLQTASAQGRILITRDRDYGNLIFVRGARCGVIYLRVLPRDIDLVHSELQKVLEEHDEHDLARAFVVVEKNRYRIRKIHQ